MANQADGGNTRDFQLSAALLHHVTNDATTGHSEDPKSHLHRPADHEHSHGWISSVIAPGKLMSLESSYHLGNYVVDRQTGEKTWEAMSIYVRLGMHMLYYGTEQAKLLQSKRAIDLLKAESEKMGKEYNNPASRSHIAPFIASFDLAPTLSEMVEPDPTKYATFNDFFARPIKPSARPIAEPNNPAVTSSPADCRMTVFPTIDLATRYWIKGAGFTLERLLGSQTLAQQFDGGALVIARLAPQDYHRWHAPVSGTVESVTEIPGAYYTVNPQAINEASTLDVFCENRRSVMVVREAQVGMPVVIVAVGAMLVGSIHYVDDEDGRPVDEAGAQIHRGQCLGAFYYGGSTVLVLYPRGTVVLDEDLVRYSTAEKPCETLMKVGWRVGMLQSGRR